MSCDAKSECPEEAHLCCWPDCKSSHARTAESVQQTDLAELLTILGMGDHARPQSPHEVFQEALGVLRERLQLSRNVDDICAENLTLTSELRQREMEIRKLSHECLGEAIRILRTLLFRPDCGIPEEMMLLCAIGTMESRQKEIAEAQMAALAGKDEAA